MKYLIDTCVISELIKKNPSTNLVEWISSISEDDLYISVMSIGELKKGISRLPESKKKKDLEKWYLDLIRRFKARTVTIDKDIAECWGNLQAGLEKKGTVMPSIDALIASTAKTKGMVVVTRDAKAIEKSGIEVLNPW